MGKARGGGGMTRAAGADPLWPLAGDERGGGAAAAGGDGWEQHLLSTVISIDRWTQLISNLNVAMGWRSCSYVHSPTARLLLRASVLAIGAANAAAVLLLRRAPEAYARARTPIAVAQRVARGAWSHALFSSMGVRGYRLFFERRAHVALAPSLLLLEQLALDMLLMVMQAMWFPLPLRLCAPIHVAFCLGRLWGSRGLACLLRSDPAMARAAAALCDASAAAKRLALALGGGAAGLGAPRGRARACEEAPAEMLITLFLTLSCLLPLLATYAATTTLKARHADRRAAAEARAAGRPPAAAPRPPVLSPAFHIMAFLSMLLLSFAAAEGVATWGRPYQCD